MANFIPLEFWWSLNTAHFLHLLCAVILIISISSNTAMTRTDILICVKFSLVSIISYITLHNNTSSRIDGQV